MSNLKLVPDDPTPLEKMLLDASRAELPSEDHKARLRAVLGIGVPLSGPFAAPAPASAAVPTTQAAASVAPPATVAAAVAAKSTTAKLAVGVGVLAVAGALWLNRESDAAPVPKAPVAAQVQAQPIAAPPPETAAAEPAAVSPLPPVEEATAAPRTRGSSAPVASAAEDLSEQIRLIEAARAGVASHDSRAALAAVDSYSAKFPRGSFGQEATVLRIRALDQAGDSARATALAKSFVARFPSSPHVARLKPIAERGASR